MDDGTLQAELHDTNLVDTRKAIPMADFDEVWGQKLFLLEQGKKGYAGVEALDFASRKLNLAQVQRIEDALKAAATFPQLALRTLNLAHASFGTLGASKVAEIMAELWSVADLDISNNTIFAQGCALLMNAIATNSRMKLERLEISGNQIQAEGAIHVERWLMNPRCSLVDLSLKFNQLMPNGAARIAAALPSCDSLKKLNLYQNHICDEGVEALALALETNTSLEWLDLGHNDFGDDGAFQLSQVLRLKNDSLVHLDIRHNEMTHLGQDFLRRGLEKNASVVHLWFGTTTVKDLRLMVGWPRIRM